MTTLVAFLRGVKEFRQPFHAHFDNYYLDRANTVGRNLMARIVK